MRYINLNDSFDKMLNEAYQQTKKQTLRESVNIVNSIPTSGSFDCMFIDVSGSLQNKLVNIAKRSLNNRRFEAKDILYFSGLVGTTFDYNELGGSNTNYDDVAKIIKNRGYKSVLVLTDDDFNTFKNPFDGLNCNVTVVIYDRDAIDESYRLREGFKNIEDMSDQEYEDFGFKVGDSFLDAVSELSAKYPKHKFDYDVGGQHHDVTNYILCDNKTIYKLADKAVTEENIKVLNLVKEAEKGMKVSKNESYRLREASYNPDGSKTDVSKWHEKNNIPEDSAYYGDYTKKVGGLGKKHLFGKKVHVSGEKEHAFKIMDRLVGREPLYDEDIEFLKAHKLNPANRKATLDALEKIAGGGSLNRRPSEDKESGDDDYGIKEAYRLREARKPDAAKDYAVYYLDPKSRNCRTKYFSTEEGAARFASANHGNMVGPDGSVDYSGRASIASPEYDK